MEASSQTRPTGLWNNPRANQSSKEVQDMLKLMMQEARVNLQRNNISKSLKNEEASPLSPPSFNSRYFPVQPRRRSAEACRAGNNYTREKFLPGPTRDLEKEKRRLQNIMAAGEEEQKSELFQDVPVCNDGDEIDRYQEVLDEIEERKQFLTDMAALGQERNYKNNINTEIIARIKELEELDEARSFQTTAKMSQRKEK